MARASRLQTSAAGSSCRRSTATGRHPKEPLQTASDSECPLGEVWWGANGHSVGSALAGAMHASCSSMTGSCSSGSLGDPVLERGGEYFWLAEQGADVSART